MAQIVSLLFPQGEDAFRRPQILFPRLRSSRTCCVPTECLGEALGARRTHRGHEQLLRAEQRSAGSTASSWLWYLQAGQTGDA